jgi:hypothetical protein
MAASPSVMSRVVTIIGCFPYALGSIDRVMITKGSGVLKPDVMAGFVGDMIESNSGTEYEA